ncbi:MAG TPA: GAF domain-containing protein [Patescibacteria group bacterium]|nr:GAF domain-containing protein [Patescibacteria group bacterium]
MTAERLAARVKRALASARDRSDAVRVAVEAVHDWSDRYDWTGVYLLETEGALVLSHFIGAPTPHTRIPLSMGICGAAAREKQTLIVPDVQADPRYLSCSLATRSEIVVPIIKDGSVYGEIDIDSHKPDAFGAADREELEQVAALLADHLAGPGRSEVSH